MKGVEYPADECRWGQGWKAKESEEADAQG